MDSSPKIVMDLIVSFSRCSIIFSQTCSISLLCHSFKNINATGFKALEQGQEVEFTVAQGEKGVEAKVRDTSDGH